MKGLSLCSIVAIAMLASPAFATDICTVNLQKLSDSKAALTTMTSPLKEQVEERIKAAEEAQRAGDLETCGTHAEKALMLLQRPSKDRSTDAQ
ncbi:MAG TPA: hypothetical protein VFF22_00735 [Pseudomonas sp.]|nr:hypothetical protein [Pseudomonas sp.]